MKKLTKPRKGKRFAYWRDGNNDRVYEPKTLDNLEVGDVVAITTIPSDNTYRLAMEKGHITISNWTKEKIRIYVKPITNSKCPTCGK